LEVSLQAVKHGIRNFIQETLSLSTGGKAACAKDMKVDSPAPI